MSTVTCAICNKEIREGMRALKYNDRIFDTYHCLSEFKRLRKYGLTSLNK